VVGVGCECTARVNVAKVSALRHVVPDLGKLARKMSSGLGSKWAWSRGWPGSTPRGLSRTARNPWNGEDGTGGTGSRGGGKGGSRPGRREA
jgi:hypothetical protein